jgi:hypothetical protein
VRSGSAAGAAVGGDAAAYHRLRYGSSGGLGYGAAASAPAAPPNPPAGAQPASSQPAARAGSMQAGRSTLPAGAPACLPHPLEAFPAEPYKPLSPGKEDTEEHVLTVSGLSRATSDASLLAPFVRFGATQARVRARAL